MRSNMLQLLSAALGKPLQHITQIDYFDILCQANKHGVANMLYYSLQSIPKDLQPDPQIKRLLKERMFAATTRDAFQDKELNAVIEQLERKEIHFLLLKGCVMKHSYPDPAMRYMSDTDILIEGNRGEKVKEILEQLGFKNRRFSVDSTDLYSSPIGMNYEVHRSLEHEGFSLSCQLFLKGLFNIAKPVEGRQYMLELPKEEHYAYILCHFVKHLLNGGIGVRQVMDVYICRKNWCFDEEKLKKRLEQLELSAFAETLERLANSWFGDAEGNAVTEELGEYILGSGVFGKEEQKVADRMLKKKKHRNKLSYAFARLFPGYQTMSAYYPVLKKIPVLLPVFWVWRMIYALIFRSRKLRTEISTLNDTDQSTLDERAAFYQRCGLNVYSEQTQKG